MKELLTALNAHYMHTSLAIRQLKAACRGLEGVETELCELHINLPYRRVLGDIARKKPEVVGFSCYIWNIGYVLRLCRALHLALPETKIVLGGPEAAFAQEELLTENESIDAVLAGEGERGLGVFGAQGVIGHDFTHGGGHLRDVAGSAEAAVLAILTNLGHSTFIYCDKWEASSGGFYQNYALGLYRAGCGKNAADFINLV
jgi:hypothetical protein